jgi:hypothetical protein
MSGRACYTYKPVSPFGEVKGLLDVEVDGRVAVALRARTQMKMR